MTTQVSTKDGEIVLDKGGALLILDKQDAAEMAKQVLALLSDAPLVMEVEHQAWIEACRRIYELTGENVNEPQWNGVIDAFRFWGETLHQLRLSNPQYDAKAYAEARKIAEEGR